MKTILSQIVPAILFVALFSSPLFSTNTFSLSDTIRIEIGQFRTGSYQLDSSGVGSIVDVNFLSQPGPELSVNIDPDYRIHYTGNDLVSVSTFELEIVGDQDIQTIVFEIAVVSRKPDSLQFYHLQFERDSGWIEVYDIDAQNIGFCFPSNVNVNVLAQQGDSVFIEVLPDNTRREVCLEICDADGVQCENLTIFSNVLDTNRLYLPPLFKEEIVCGNPSRVCMPMDVFSMGNINMEIFLDGQVYSGGVQPCGYTDSTYILDLDILSPDPISDYEVDDWEINGISIPKFKIDSVQELIDTLNVYLPQRRWAYDSQRNDITAKVFRLNLGTLRLRHVPSMDTVYALIRPFFETSFSNGVLIDVPLGNYPLEVNFPEFNYSLSSEIDYSCNNLSGDFYEIFDTIRVNQTIEVLVNIFNLVPPYTLVNERYPDGMADNAIFEFLAADKKVRITGLSEGLEEYELIVCDNVLCDTFQFEITVLPESFGKAIYVEDTFLIDLNHQVYVDPQGRAKPVSSIRYYYDDGVPNVASFAYEPVYDTLYIEPFNLGIERGSIVVCDANLICDTIFITAHITNGGGDLHRFNVYMEKGESREVPLTPFNLTLPLNCQDLIYLDGYDDVANIEFNPTTKSVTVYSGNLAGTEIANLILCGSNSQTDTFQFYVDVVDTIGTITLYGEPGPPLLLLDCEDPVPPPPPVLGLSLCPTNDTLLIDFSEIVNNDTCIGSYTIERTWIVTDECGEEITLIQILEIRDDKPPVINSPLPPTNIFVNELNGESIPPFVSLDATDNCDSDIELKPLEILEATGDSTIQIVRFYIFEDACGNYVDALSEINVHTSPVWPGDANLDGTVDGSDLFPLGFVFGDTGVERPDASIDYNAQPSLEWQSNQSSGINQKHIDTDGDGQISTNDTLAIFQNWGLDHPKGIGKQAITSDFPVELEIVSVTQDGWVTMDVLLGNEDRVLNDFYGGYFTFEYNETLQSDEDIYFTQTLSWAGAPSNYVRVGKHFPNDKLYSIALVKTDKIGMLGYGKIGTLKFKLSLPLPTEIQVGVKSGEGITFQEEPFTVEPFSRNFELIVSTNEKGLPVENIAIFPNPANDEIFIDLPISSEGALEVKDVNGKTLIFNRSLKQKINISSLMPGYYQLLIYTKNNIYMGRFVKM